MNSFTVPDAENLVKTLRMLGDESYLSLQNQASIDLPLDDPTNLAEKTRDLSLLYTLASHFYVSISFETTGTILFSATEKLYRALKATEEGRSLKFVYWRNIGAIKEASKNSLLEGSQDEISSSIAEAKKLVSDSLLKNKDDEARLQIPDYEENWGKIQSIIEQVYEEAPKLGYDHSLIEEWRKIPPSSLSLLVRALDEYYYNESADLISETMRNSLKLSNKFRAQSDDMSDRINELTREVKTLRHHSKIDEEQIVELKRQLREYQSNNSINGLDSKKIIEEMKLQGMLESVSKTNPDIAQTIHAIRAFTDK